MPSRRHKSISTVVRAMRRASAPAFRKVGLRASSVVFAIAAMILLASPARAGCNPSDIFNATKQSVSGLSDCASACATGAGCAAAAAATGILTEIAASAGQGVVNSFCSQVQGNAIQILGSLQSAGGSSIGQNLLDKFADALTAVGSPATVVQCACQTEQGVGSLGSDLGQCMEDVLCWLQGVLGDSCDCERPPPAIVSCPSIDVKKCLEDHDYSGVWNPACIPSAGIVNCNPNWQQCGYEGYSPSVAKLQTPEGTLAEALPATAEGTGCYGASYCFCPVPMNPTWHQVPNPGGDLPRFMFTCDCPYDPNDPDHQTHPGALMANGISSCLCNNTNQPANFGFAPFGMCPPAACPAGQTRLGLNGACVTPCSDPSQGMAFDGSCCSPAQMSSCGQCCPPSTVPDPKSGSCVPRPQQPK
ncbi:hypothetical protein UNPF46_27435 [Bradyrhizobium sp. UNPF46]|nr:hypothetical protein UNPF46_27435 [Bradyrhizobium sp. UNPF46]